MFKSSLLAALGAAFVLTGVGASHALAQSAPAPQTTPPRVSRDGNSEVVTTESRGRFGNRRENRNATAQPTPEENIAAAQAIVATTSVTCQVTEARYIGQTADGAKSYEAACGTGPGYIVLSTTPPQAIDCVLLNSQAITDRARDPNATIGTECTIPQNADLMRVISVYATEAGVPCAANEGMSIGRSAAGNLVYEVGCDGVDGFWLEKEPTGWKKTECAIVVTQSGVCRFSTTAEGIATFKSRLTGSEAAACDVTENRYMGANANGAFWEAKCGAGNGVIVRFNTEQAVQQVYPCETAQLIGGGCRLTVVPAAPAAAAPATE